MYTFDFREAQALLSPLFVEYDLFAIIVHQGTMDSGHYIAYFKHKDKVGM
jgi:ubiquitin C-terminal hydrolase